jgi:tape measure domain-containing protein
MSQLAQIASLASQYQAQYQSGELSGSEFKELMESIDAAQHIQATASELEQDMVYRQIIMGALQVANALA